MEINKIMTELEAVNYMMISIGEQPINSLSETRSTHVHMARSVLNQTSRQVQSLGLRCNSEYNYSFNLSPTQFDEKVISIPDDVLRVDASDPRKQIVLRGNRLYDLERHTYNFKENIECDVVWFLKFSELPQVVKDYIMLKASRVYQSKIVGSPEQFRFSAMEEREAYSRLIIEEIDGGDYNMLDHPEVISQNRRF